ncbi:MAG: YtxH domain-containing protein [Nitrospirota bacterium]|jgi:gas vesicle protein
MGDDRGFSAGTVFMAFIFGGAIGAGLALLLAPQSGKETMEKLKGLTEDVTEKASRYADQIKEKVNSAIEEGKGLMGEKKSIITTAIEAGKEAMEKEKERLIKEKDKAGI